MKADLTRSTFRREKHFSSVRMQQGRVQLDADWNEQLDIEAHLENTTRVDVIGPCGAPNAAAGFEIDVTPDGSDLTISPGRIYVDGVLCELESTPIAVVGASGSALLLEENVADGHVLAAGDWVSLRSGGSAPTLAKLAKVDPAQNSVTFAAGGPKPADLKALAAAVDPTLTWVATYLTQPDFPGPRPAAIGLPAGGYLAYLDVWQQHRTALEDREIRETALGGPDTATRTRTVWQLRLFPAAATANRDGPSCQSDPSGFPTATSGRLRARAEPQTQASDPCTIPPGAGFRRLENQLYRVEIHDPGEPGNATFKWSRENGSVVVRWLGDKGSDALVDSLGRDDVLGIAPGNLVELTSDLDELAGAPGLLVTVDATGAADSGDSTLTLAAAPPAFPGDAPHPRVRRWEGTQNVATGWIGLEDGVEVEFAAGWYNTGDYWLVPARTTTGDVEWPNDGGDPTANPPVPPSPILCPPEGIVHGYCKLAALTFGTAWSQNAVCRLTFPPLTDLPGSGPRVEPGIHVLDVHTLAGRSLRNDSPVQASELAQGLEILCDADVEPGTIEGKPTLVVTLDLPYPMAVSDLQFWSVVSHIKEVFGTLPLTFDCSTRSDGRRLQWVPRAPASQVIKSIIPGLVRAGIRRGRLLVHLTLKGNFVYAVGNPDLDLDGDAFSVLDGSTLDLKLPSGDGRRGGDLEMWLWLVPDPAQGLTNVVVGSFAKSRLLAQPARQLAGPEILSLVDDGAKLRQLVPAQFALDETAQPQLEQAKARAGEVGLVGQTLVAAVDDRIAGAADLFAQEIGQIGVGIRATPMPGDTIIQQGAALPEHGFDLVIAGRDVVDKANEVTANLVPPNTQIQL